jgi:uncharacterized protein YecA (UPF0149 family)
VTLPTPTRSMLLSAAMLAASSDACQAPRDFPGAGAGKRSRLRRAETPLYRAGRNDPCPCGSGKKFKRCCIGKTQEIRINTNQQDE